MTVVNRGHNTLLTPLFHLSAELNVGLSREVSTMCQMHARDVLPNLAAAADLDLPPQLLELVQAVWEGAEEYPIRLKDGVTAKIQVRTYSGLPTPLIIVVVRSEEWLPEVDKIQRAHNLTRREAEVARLMGQGLSDKEIAARLNVTRACASRHGEKVRAKLGVSSRRHVRNVLFTRPQDARPSRPSVVGLLRPRVAAGHDFRPHDRL